MISLLLLFPISVASDPPTATATASAVQWWPLAVGQRQETSLARENSNERPNMTISFGQTGKSSFGHEKNYVLKILVKYLGPMQRTNWGKYFLPLHNLWLVAKIFLVLVLDIVSRTTFSYHDVNQVSGFSFSLKVFGWELANFFRKYIPGWYKIHWCESQTKVEGELDWKPIFSHRTKISQKQTIVKTNPRLCF